MQGPLGIHIDTKALLIILGRVVSKSSQTDILILYYANTGRPGDLRLLSLLTKATINWLNCPMSCSVDLLVL